MDNDDLKQLDKQAQDNIRNAMDYAKYVELEAKARFHFNLVLAAHFSSLREKKSNIGIEVASLMLIEPAFLPEDQRKEVCEYYEDMLKYEAKSKGLAVIIDAVKGRLILNQSAMKHEQEENR